MATRHCCHSAFELHCVELRAFALQLRLDHASERKVHVVAAEQDVFANGDTVECQLAVLLFDGDQREVGCAAADVDDEDEIADRDLLAPVRIGFDPRVEGCLWLFEKNQVLVSGLLRRMRREFTCNRIE